MGRLSVNVIGWFNKANIGDESYTLAFPLLFPSVDFVFSDTFIEGCDATILGGGDVVTLDNIALLKRSTGRKFIMSVTISQDFPASAYEGIDDIIVRDFASLEDLKRKGVPVRMAPDFAHILRPHKEQGLQFIKNSYARDDLELYERRIAVVLNGHFTHFPTTIQNVQFEKLAFDIGYLMDNTNASFFFLPFGTSAPWDDRIPNGWAISKSKWFRKNQICYERLTPQMSLDVISACDAVISTRLHSSIFSCVAGVPFLDITHNHKNPAYLKVLGKSDWGIPFSSFDVNEGVSLIKSFLNEQRHKAVISKMATKQQQLLKDTVQDVCFV